MLWLGTPDFLRTLDRALGRLPDPRTPFVPPPRYEGALALPVPVAFAEPLLFAARRLLLELEGYLEARGGGAAALAWTLRHTGGDGTRVDLGLAAPARDAARLLKLLRERLERTRLAAPVEGVELLVERVLPLAPVSLDLWTARESQAELAWPELIDRLRAHLGAGAVQGLRLAADHRPERAFARTEAGQGGTRRLRTIPLFARCGCCTSRLRCMPFQVCRPGTEYHGDSRGGAEGRSPARGLSATEVRSDRTPAPLH